MQIQQNLTVAIIHVIAAGHMLIDLSVCCVNVS